MILKLKALALFKGVLVGIAIASVLPPLGVLSRHQPAIAQSSLQSDRKALIDEVWQIVNQRYIDPTFNQQDWQAVRQQFLSRTYSSDEMLYDALDEMLGLLGDDLSRHLDPQEFREMQANPSSGATGIGLGLSLEKETGNIVVAGSFAGSAAFRAGILVGDVLVSIDGVTTAGMTASAVASLLRGPANSTVSVTVLRDQRQQRFEVERIPIEPRSVQYRMDAAASGNIGYIRLLRFDADAFPEMQAALTDLESQGAAAYVLDLRSNPGGLLFSAVNIARIWLQEGLIVSIEGRDDVYTEQADGTAISNQPLAILIDEGSASASEILAGALQDQQRAVLVGTSTSGSNSIQSVRPLSRGSALAVTVAKWAPPSGKDISDSGLEPDVVVELSDTELQTLHMEYQNIGTLADPQFAAAVDALALTP